MLTPQPHCHDIHHHPVPARGRLDAQLEPASVAQWAALAGEHVGVGVGGNGGASERRQWEGVRSASGVVAGLGVALGVGVGEREREREGEGEEDGEGEREKEVAAPVPIGAISLVDSSLGLRSLGREISGGSTPFGSNPPYSLQRQLRPSGGSESSQDVSDSDDSADSYGTADEFRSGTQEDTAAAALASHMVACRVHPESNSLAGEPAPTPPPSQAALSHLPPLSSPPSPPARAMSFGQLVPKQKFLD